MGILKWVRARRHADKTTVSFDAGFRPIRPFFAIGDVHGRADLLDRLLARLDKETRSERQSIVLLGDYIDHGPDSARVLEILRGLQTDGRREVVCLMGNHERMMLDFLRDPTGVGLKWLRYGGQETLRSFGIEPGVRGSDPDTAPVLRDALSDAMSSGLFDWLNTLPLCWQSGNIICVHAALDPRRAADEQLEKAALWGHARFLSDVRQDGNWVVHGHTIVQEPVCEAGRISVDTGAYRTDRLTAAYVSDTGCRFLTA